MMNDHIRVLRTDRLDQEISSKTVVGSGSALTMDAQADLVLPHFKDDWEKLSAVAERCGIASHRLKHLATNLYKRGLVEQRWDPSLSLWRKAQAAPAQREEHWIPLSVLGSAYEEEMDANSRPLRYRHRPVGHPVWSDGLSPVSKRTG
jgi:hypothetical protein